jgi:uncharacterized membrane protein
LGAFRKSIRTIFVLADVPQEVTMESRAKLLGHPIHPMLIVFPLGLLATAVISDVLYVATGNSELAVFSYWALVAGLLGGLLAAVFGLWDWLNVPSGTRAKRIGLLHGGGNLVVVLLFAISFFLRMNDATYLPSVLPLVFGVAGALLALCTAWLGGELVYRLRIGVDDAANPDATSSLRQPVAEMRRAADARR